LGISQADQTEGEKQLKSNAVRVMRILKDCRPFKKYGASAGRNSEDSKNHAIGDSRARRGIGKAKRTTGRPESTVSHTGVWISALKTADQC